MIDAALIQRALRTAIAELQLSNNRLLLHMLERALDEAQGIAGLIEENRSFRFRYGRERRP